MKDPFIRVFQAYRAGITRKKPGDPNYSPVPKQGFETVRRLFYEELQYQGFLGLLSTQERWAYRRITKRSYEGLFAARSGKTDEALAIFEEVWGEIDAMPMGPCRLMLVAFVQANWAYLEHRLGSVDRAHDRLDMALESDLSLEENFDLSLYQMHRLQLGHNLVRVAGRAGDLRESFDLAGRLIAFMEGTCRDLPYHRNWYPDRLLSVSRSLIRSMILQVAGETIEFVVVCGEPKHWSVFTSALHLRANEDDLRFLDPRLWRWLKAQEDREEQDVETFLEVLEELFPIGPRNLGTIYYSMLVDFASLCTRINSFTAKKVCDAMLKDSMKWKGVPPTLAGHLGAMAA